jgi:ssDNA-binding Zn-finger/Zn-ribbon topoisomerase 1
MTITVSGTCPNCGHALKVCQAKSRAFYLRYADFPRCTFRCAYVATLQALRDRNARLQAEITLLQMQRTPPRQEEQPPRPGTKVVQRQRRAMYTWADIAAKWGGKLCDRSERAQL